MSKRFLHLLRGLLAAAAFFSIAHASPEFGAWRQEILIGDNEEFFFRYVTDSVHPGSYYICTRTLRLEKVRKTDAHVMKTYLLRKVHYSQHPDSLRWAEASDSLPAFDLTSYLRDNRVELAFPSELIHARVFRIDAGGVWEVLRDGSVRLATRRELERQIPSLGEHPRVVGIEQTGPDSGKDLYLLIDSGDESWDDDWDEGLLVIHGGKLR